MSTRPDTIAAALADSPAGLAAWIIDKYRAWSDCDGDLERRFDRDTLCTDPHAVLGDRVHRHIVPPVPRLPAEHAPAEDHGAGRRHAEPRAAVRPFPRSIAERAASDIRQYSTPGRGGHFLAFEEPQLIADELGAFMRSVG